MKSPLRVGFIGSGFISKFHAKAIAQCRNIEITAIHTRSDANSFIEFCRELGVGEVRSCASIKELCNYVDAVAIYAPNDFRIEHLEEIAAAKKAGAPVVGVITEKPLARTVKEGRKTLEIVKAAGLKTAYFENQIYMNTIQSQRNQLLPMMEKMGPLSLVRSSEEHGGPHNAWFWDPRIQGGGVLSDMGCHSIAVGWYLLTPPGKKLDFLKPISVTCNVACLKWGKKPWSDELKKKFQVDFEKTPSEDFATGMVVFENPETKERSIAQFTDSWMYEKQGLRLLMDGTGPGYAFEINTLISPLQIFISDMCAEAIGNAELALEKSTSSRGLLTVQANEADLYGYTDENRDAAQAFSRNQDAMLNFEFGFEITRLVLASYMSAEKKCTVDLTDEKTLAELENYVPLIQQGRGREVLF